MTTEIVRSDPCLGRHSNLADQFTNNSHLDENFWCVPAKEVKGITTMAFLVKDGIIVAADYPRGSVENVFRLGDGMFVTVSGEIGYCESLLEDLQRERARGLSILEASKFAARHLRKLSKETEGLPVDMLTGESDDLPVGMLMGGWEGGVPVLYRVNGKGQLARGNAFAVGSGHIFAFNFLTFCGRKDMPVDEATEVARKVTCMTASVASEYCGFVTAYYIGADGEWTTVIDNEDIKVLLEMKYERSLTRTARPSAF